MGDLVLDDGAAKAVIERGSSLLAKGITQTQGTFSRGDVVRLRNQQGQLLAKGIVSYSDTELALLIGKHSTEIEATLGYAYGATIIHRDDLVIIQE